MHILLTIIAFVVIFSVLVLIHEMGHFLMAKRAGIKVMEFGFGLPPRIWGKKVGETIYSVNWIPFGGFVRMMGEDSKSSLMLKNKRSFIAQSARTRFLVLIAGVTMNFILAWILLTAGYTAGMQPLLLPSDVLNAVDKEQVIMQEGVTVKEVLPSSIAEKLGVKAGDILYSVNGKVLEYDKVDKVFDSPVGTYKFIKSDGVFVDYVVNETDISKTYESEDFGIKFYDVVPFPVVKVINLSDSSAAYLAGLRNGDSVLKINGARVYDTNEFYEKIGAGQHINMDVYREGVIYKIEFDTDVLKKVIISEVLPNTPAYKAKLLPGDVILSVDKQQKFFPEDVIDYVKVNLNKTITFLIERDGHTIFYYIKPNSEGRIGVLLSPLDVYGKGQQMSVYNSVLSSSILEIKNEKYPFYISAYKSFYEMVRLSKLTAIMFTDFVVDVVTTQTVAEDVAGPVGIATMTSVFVREGLVSLLRFMALLSLSLAVINVLPLPALDGGRILFVLFEMIFARRFNQKLEAIIHTIGYCLIILLILAVTYSDIEKIVLSW